MTGKVVRCIWLLIAARSVYVHLVAQKVAQMAGISKSL
jgi:hypothetical protein